MSETGANAEPVTPGRTTMPLLAHLVELRNRVLKATIAIVLAFFVAWAFHVELYDWLIAPIRDAMADNGLFSIKALQITESIAVYIRLAVFGGIFLASPVIFYQIWAFVAPGLKRAERATVIPVIAASVVFFVAGAAFCYLVVLPFMTDFLIKLTLEGEGLTLEPTLQSTFSYALWLLLAFGVVFELPVFMYFLSALGMVTSRGLLAFYRYWVVIAFIVGAILTPTPDPINQALMSGPLVVLYGLGIGIAWLVEQDRAQDRRIPWRAVAVLVLLLVGGLAVGFSQVAGRGKRAPLADIPTDVHQLVGAHLAGMSGLRQRATDPAAARAMGPVGLLEVLDLKEGLPSTLWMARFDDGVAMVVPWEGAQAVPRRIAKEREVSVVPYAGGPSALFVMPGARGRWRVAAPDEDTLWIGHDAALAHLAAVRRGQVPAFGADPLLVDAIASLRASGPLWGASMSGKGIAAWLPGGALADTVTLAAATVDARATRLMVEYNCKGEDAARALRARLDSWTADVRRPVTTGTEGIEAVRELASKLAQLTRLMERAATSGANISPQGSDDHINLVQISQQAGQMAEQLDSLSGNKGDDKPQERPLLERLVQAPAVSTTRTDGAQVRWTIEAPSGIVLAALFAASEHGLAPEALARQAPKKPVAEKTTDDEGPAGREVATDPGAGAPAPQRAATEQEPPMPIREDVMVSPRGS